ncbi:type II secretion system F family protein [Phycicoccus flavus]|uniref:type II secretion system F family protein n=1 Tax=Phycicoccus flavus TaxID=2502783 RepID=UPI000FEC12EF|nr:type II secretion system F family protein [Phycicoccus flavus]NHA68289.1 hypothetical protein [Phycicoccus flavus]
MTASSVVAALLLAAAVLLAARPVGGGGPWSDVVRCRLPSLGWRWRPRAGAGAGEEWVADLAEVVAVGLRAGLDLASALRAAASAPSVVLAAPWLGEALERRPGGATPSEVLAARPDGVAAEGLEVLARAWRLSEVTGASAAHTTAAAAEAVRATAATRRRVETALAGPTASMRLLTLLPLAGPGAALLVGLDVRSLYGSAAARLAVVVGVSLTGLGWWWCRRLVRRASRPGTTAG